MQDIHKEHTNIRHGHAVHLPMVSTKKQQQSLDRIHQKKV